MSLIDTSDPVPPPDSASQGPSASKTTQGRSWTIESMNQAVRGMEYAVRGPLALRAETLRASLESSSQKSSLPFDKILNCNIGNPQQKGLDQPPLTFWRQVFSLVEYPALLQCSLPDNVFPEDAKRRAEELLKHIGSIGAYSHSKGVPFIRQNVADFLHQRDGHEADPENIFLTAGASAGVSQILNALIGNPAKEAVLIPRPQYPLYSAALAIQSTQAVYYALDEARGWALDRKSLEQAIEQAADKGVTVRALVIINPGNPTGSSLPLEDVQYLLKFAHTHRLVLMADEVYQMNIYHPQSHPFISFKKALMDSPEDIKQSVELVSFHSISKGVSGECGRRGGFFEAVNLDPSVMEQLYKMASVSLCPPISGQIGVDLMVRPPKQGEPSYECWKKETDQIQTDLKERSAIVSSTLNQAPAISCNDAQGAMYLFPRIELPPKAHAAAKAEGVEPDAFYCMALLNQTGIVVVPGSGFGQAEDTLHFRTTVLVPGAEAYANRIVDFHREFIAKYS